ncbi:FecR domain-containing protein [Nisaea acidiphila]|uniref:FecR domain-containing protein n=1 Tax=Nisaea acidiphila TaxID=1862145 RepID=A0A9J7ASE3_9PROT|nr:FecR domain-containing protein [Nisaea acidiphila]UUX50563.1 FecR domain-containing protein [Nisaea acidiphila]
MAFSLRLALTASIMALLAAASADAEVGNVRLVKIWAYSKAASTADWNDLYRRDPVELNERLRTPDGGALHVRFVDDTDLRLGSAAEILIDRFVFDPSNNAGALQAEMGKGVFRFISGRMAKDGVRLGTPSAFIGIRGTDFIVDVRDDGSTVVAVLEGEVEITPRAGGPAVAIAANQTALVSLNATAVQIGVAAVTVDAGLDSDAGIDADSGSGGAGGQGGGDTGGND